MWRRPAWFSLKGKVGVRCRRGTLSYATQPLSSNQPADPCNTAPLADAGRGFPTRVAEDYFALRSRHAFRSKALNHLDRLQGARDGNL
jgi:hypothetical protein